MLLDIVVALDIGSGEEWVLRAKERQHPILGMVYLGERTNAVEVLVAMMWYENM